MAATELLKESPDGHANSMGTCYSAGKKKTPISSARSLKGEAKRTPNSTQPAPRSSSTGKTRPPQISCSQQALSRRVTSKDCCTSTLGSASGAHTPPSCKKSQSSLARSLSSEDQARTPPKDSQQLTTAEDCHTNGFSTANAIHAHHTSRNSNSSDGKKQTHHTRTNSNMSNTGSASSGFVAGTSKPTPMHTDRHHTLPSVSSPRNSHRLASSRAKQDDLPTVQSRVGEMRAPPVLHKINSLSLKSGVGPYEVLTTRKSIEGLQGTTPRNSGRRLIKSGSFSSLGTKDQGAKGLCKNCKTSTLDSVCFIANDGKIAAANTGPSTTHHCNSPKCAANPNYHPPSSLPCKKILSKSQPAPTQPARTKSRINVSHAKDDRIVCASLSDNDVDLPRCTQLCREDSHIDAENVCRKIFESNQGGKESNNEQPSVCIQGVDAQEICSENGNINVVAPAQSANDDIDQSSPIGQEGVQRIDLKALPYHGDNESSCSDDGMDTPTTPKRSTKDAFDDLQNMEFAQSKASQARKSSMERMRHKYLDTLKEQEAETVRLKKQEMHARKQAGDWMLDCAMGEILHKLAPDGEAGVKVLVEAFETILQHSDVEAHHEENAAHECIGSEDLHL